ncbi:MAG: chromosome segregation protein SMC [Gammaproteobacteria bacterium]
MRLSKVKLAGFKSFVDPTTIQFPSNLVGIVGPNGCGKSNVIDAVRWVMGETSAKHLRGDSMADVIFNGSSARKPVGSASIELVFDNSDGAVGGQYASYAEISVKRAVSRDGTSTYFLNGTRCRRKDITTLFLGTGLGPRSYAIIEQGMISRLIEARPEELRTYLEEAAGISKYKERRRETENRMRHTRENLERLNDLRDEVEKQIRHLQRQARTAERYRELKQDERRLEAELLALRLGELESEESARTAALSEQETALQGSVASLRQVEAAIEKAREQHQEESEALNEVQGRYYRLGAEIARLEQAIQHGKELRQRQQRELEEAEQGLKDIRHHIDRDRDVLDQLNLALGELGPSLEEARSAEATSAEALRSAEQNLEEWRARWQSFSGDASAAREVSEVERARIEQLESQLLRLTERRKRRGEEAERLQLELDGQDVSALQSRLEEARESENRLEAAIEDARQQTDTLRTQDRELTAQLDEGRGRLQTLRGQLASQEALQEAALGHKGGKVAEWLNGRGLGNNPRLAQQISAADGWERAVETVLGGYLEAVCVEGLDGVAEALDGLTHGAASFLEAGSGRHEPSGQGETLESIVSGPSAVIGLMAGVRVAQHLGEALALRHRLRPGESVITREGIWIGPNWLRVNRAEDPRAGVLARERQIRELRGEIDQAATEVEQRSRQHARVREQLEALEEAREQRQQEAAEAHRGVVALEGQVETSRARREQFEGRLEALSQERTEISQQIQEADESLRASRGRLQGSVDQMSAIESRRGVLESEREALVSAVQAARDAAARDRQNTQDIAIRVESRRSSLDSAQLSLQRFQDQLARFSARRDELSRQLESGVEPLAARQEELEGLLGQRVDVDEALGEARRVLQGTEARLRELQGERSESEQAVETARGVLEEARLVAREISVRRQTAQEQFTATGFELEALRAEMPGEAGIEPWEESLEKLRRRIERLGPINLASIDELKEQSERKTYLDAQFEDLTDALTTLENAIRKIDRETRTRFKETFDRVNAGLQDIFPRLFGGGHAFLELGSEDLLEAGVTVMARPPGKRISTIHLLSGGEKALSAVALVFSIFQLNPAPFCMLDEVDAPLDDANVSRFCDIVRSMSDRVQFIIITHNKTTMEMASQLTGVTMQEPGVSRLVAVDIDEAVEMVAV